MKTDLNSLLNRVDTRLAACAALAAAGAAVTATPAKADIIYSGVVNHNIPSTTAGVYLNVVTGGTTTGSSTGLAGWDVNPWSTGGLGLFNSANPGGAGTYVTSTAGGTMTLNLALGSLISGANFFGSNSSTAAGAAQFSLNSSNNLVGFRFLNEATGVLNYGWMRISLSTAPGAQPRSIVEYAYENTGAGIGAGVIPEPSTMALLSLMAVGAVGVRAWRKRKAA